MNLDFTLAGFGEAVDPIVARRPTTS